LRRGLADGAIKRLNVRRGRVWAPARRAETCESTPTRTPSPREQGGIATRLSLTQGCW
jgi:hypothetical protein